MSRLFQLSTQFLPQVMAAARRSSGEEDEVTVAENEYGALQTAEKSLFEDAKCIEEEREKISQRRRQCFDKLCRLITAEKRDSEKRRQTAQRLIGLETGITHVERENETLGLQCEIEIGECTNSKCIHTINKLKESLDETANNSRTQTHEIAELNAKIADMQQSRSENIAAGSETGNSIGTKELQQKLDLTNELLSQTIEELNEMRQRLSDVQERLTVAEQVTAATQQRALQESDNSEQLQLEPTAQQPAECTGLNLFFSRHEH